MTYFRHVSYLLLALCFLSCNWLLKPVRKPASDSAIARPVLPATPFGWVGWLKKNYPDWYFESSRLDKDKAPWPAPFNPDSNPIYAHNELLILNLKPDQVFEVMIHASRWIDFYPNTDQPHVTGSNPPQVLESLTAMSRFDWTTFSVTQHMKITEFVKSPQESRLAWSGGSLGTSVYLRWIMRSTGDGTEVTLEECERGVAPVFDNFLLNPAIRATHQLWLENLKKYILKEPI